MIKALLLDFDGTLVTQDILSLITDLNGKSKESEELNQLFHKGLKPGTTALIERINLLKGLSISAIEKKLEENLFLMPGVEELLDFVNKEKILTFLISGNIFPVLGYYKSKLGIDYVIGSQPFVVNGIIQGIKEEDYPAPGFKVSETQKLLEHLDIHQENVIAIGDSPADKGLFQFAHISIAINPKEGMEKFADYTIHSLDEAIPIIVRYI